VVGVGVDVDFYAGTCGDAEGGFAGVKLIAADGAAGYVADEAIVLPVLEGSQGEYSYTDFCRETDLGLADVCPGAVAVDDGKRVYPRSVMLSKDRLTCGRTVSAGHRSGSEKDCSLHLGSEISAIKCSYYFTLPLQPLYIPPN